MDGVEEIEMAARGRAKGFDWRAIIQSLVGALLLAACGFIYSSISGVYKTVTSHSATIETIPSIKTDIEKANGKIEQLGQTIPKLVTWEQLNTKLQPTEKKIDDIGKEQQEASKQLAIQQGIRDALSKVQPVATPLPSPK